MRRSILALMSNVCYLVVTLIFWLLLGGYCLLPSGYWWLLLVTTRYCSFPLLVWTVFNVIFISTCLIKILNLLFIQARCFSLQDSFMRNKVGSIVFDSLVDHMIHCICLEIFKCSAPLKVVNCFIILPNFVSNRCGRY